MVICMDRKKSFNIILCSLFLQVLLISVFLWFGQNGRQTVFTQLPAWNDEDFYFNQIKSVLVYGQPLGYYGYDGSHASVGHFGFHGFLILWPYILIAAIGGLHLYTMALTNLLLLCVGEAVYIYVMKLPMKKAVLFVVLVNSPLLTFYSTTEMVEGENYFWAIILAALLHQAANNSCRRNLIALGITTGFASLCKPTFSVFFIPFWLFLCVHKNVINRLQKLIVIILGSCVCTGVVYYIFTQCRADYFKGTTQIAKYQAAFHMGGWEKGLLEIIRDFAQNLAEPFRVSLVGGQWWYFWGNMYVVTVCVISVIFIFVRKDIFRWIPAILSLGTVLASCLLYAGNGRTFYPAAVAAALLMLNVLPDKKSSIVPIIVFSLYFLMTFVIKGIWGYDARTYRDACFEKNYMSIEQYMSNIKIDENSDSPWENTLAILMCAYPPTEYERSSPPGTGINYYMTLPARQEDFYPSWVLLTQNSLDYVEILESWDYSIVDSDESTILMEKR